MVQVRIKVKADLRGLEALRAALGSDLRRRENIPVKIGMQKAATILRNHLVKRFNALSSGGGGGQWKKNAPSTIAKKGHSRILIESEGSLLKALDTKMTRKGFFVGFAQDGVHPNAGIGILELATIQHGGGVTPTGGIIPARPLVPKQVPPAVTAKMALAIQEGYFRVATRRS